MQNHLIIIRDLINEMEPNFNFVENITLCHERLGKIMDALVFNDTRIVSFGIILCFNEKNKNKS